MLENWIFLNNRQKYINVCDYISVWLIIMQLIFTVNFLICIVFNVISWVLKEWNFWNSKNLIEKRIWKWFFKENTFNVELSNRIDFGDLSSNVALVFSKFFKISLQLAEFISSELKKISMCQKLR